MKAASPHFKVRDAWLKLVREEVIDAEQPIFDCHHHLWDRPEGLYGADELAADVGDGHDVRASLYVQCRTGYVAHGPEEMRPVGEVETILDWSKDQPHLPVGLVAFADLQLGAAVRPVLKALKAAGKGRVLGVRNTTAWHADPAVRSNPNPPPDGLLRTDAFLAGAREVAKEGLCLDVWAYQSQLAEVAHLARALPELTIIVDHCGGPLGVGPYRIDDKTSFVAWRSALAEVAALPNTRIKIGGFGLTVIGYRYADEERPPQSERLAADWRPHVEDCLALFGSERAMFESNFPVDKGQFGYRTLWNAFKRLSDDLDSKARDDLFWRTAARCYGIDERIFTTHTGRNLS
ncbi:amidohydrolase family protein [uncultured Cohaesibacter sp.]|uniref:amidohydrolase family protein n=1 Tax=uncultured Cohaesibacter sp. TaxID=1002546 RepID=UPI002AAA893D|nr:amidohydrolase family protein [uncultured Cohaesibacter sp.]